MMKRNAAAHIIAAAIAAGTDPKLIHSLMREHLLLFDQTLDRSFRGCGNAAARRQGIDTQWYGCTCVVCVEYGGDCENQMWHESHSEWHRAQRGVKTRGA